MNGKDSRIIYAVIASSTLCIIGAIVAAIVITGHLNARSMPVVSGLLGILAVLIPALTAMIKGAENRQMIREVDRKVDGHITRLTEAAINAGVRPEDLPPAPPELQKPSDVSK